MKKRAIRRHHAKRLKEKARGRIESHNRYSVVYKPTEKNIGRSYQVHGAFCSGALCCGNPRRYLKDKLTIQEKRNNLKWIAEKEID